MQNAGLQYGQGVTPVQESPFGGNSTVLPTAPGNTTSTLRQFRKKENVDKSHIAGINGGVIQNTGNANGETSNSSHVARVAPHNHYPHKQNEYYRYPPQYQEYGSPVKYSEIAETVPQQIPHLDHLPQSIISKHKEKEYDMCNIPPPPPPLPSQQTHLNKSYPEHQFNTQQGYHHSSEMAAALHHHHQYMHKEVTPQGPQMHSPYKSESQYIPKDGNFNHQIPPFLKYNLPQSRNYPSIDNYQRMDPHIARSLMPEHHMRDYPTDYTSIEQNRMYSQKQRYYPTPLSNTNYAHNYPSHRNISNHQQYNYASCNYPPRTNQMGRYAINMERSISPRRTYPENLEMGINFSGVQKIASGYPPSGYSGYSQHYQHRRPPPPTVPEYYHHPQQHPHPRQYIPPHHHHHQQEVEENHVTNVSNNIRQYLENWAEEEATTELNAQSAQIENPKFISRLNRDETNEVYVINASDLPQYLESGVPLVTSENGQYVFKSNVSIDTSGAIKILDNKTVENAVSPTTTDPQERVVSLHIVENPKTDCLALDSTVVNLITNTDFPNAENNLPTKAVTDSNETAQNIRPNSEPPLHSHQNDKKLPCDSSDNDKNLYEVPPQTSTSCIVSTQNFDESLLPTVPSDATTTKTEEILNEGHEEELDRIVEDTLTSSNINIPIETCSELPKVDHENENTYIPDDLNLDLETKTEEIIDLSTSKNKSEVLKNSMKHMPSLIDEAASMADVDQKKEEIPKINEEIRENDEKSHDEESPELPEEEKTEKLEIQEEKKDSDEEIPNNEPIEKLCEELRERRKEGASRKKRIFSVDDIINRIGSNSISNRRKSLHSNREQSETVENFGQKEENLTKIEENRAKSCPNFEIEENAEICHYLIASDDITSSDKTPEFLEMIEQKINEKKIEENNEKIEKIHGPLETIEKNDEIEEEKSETSNKRKSKNELTFEERFVEPYQSTQEKEETSPSPKSSQEETVYRSVLRVEENNVLLEICGELVEINVATVNGKKVITVTPMSNSTVVDINENYEDAIMPILEEETYEKEVEKDEDIPEKTPPVLDKMIESEPPPQEIFEDLILDENEIVIGYENLEEEINLDLENSIIEEKSKEDIPEKPVVLLCTKASRKLYEDKPKKPRITPSRCNKVKTKEKPESNKKQQNTMSTRKNMSRTKNLHNEDSQIALRELIKRRKMRKEKLRLKYSQYAMTNKTSGQSKKDGEIKKTKKRKEENCVRKKKIEKNMKKIDEGQVSVIKTTSEDIPTSAIVSTTNPSLSLTNFQSVHVQETTENRTQNKNTITTTTTTTTKHETKFMKNSTPRDLSLTKNVNEHCLSRKDHTHLKKKLSIQEYNSRKRKLEIKNDLPEIDEKSASSSCNKTPTGVNDELEAPLSAKAPSTIYSQFDFASAKDPRRRSQNSSTPHKLFRSNSESVSVQAEPSTKQQEDFQKIPSILFENPLTNAMPIQDYKTYKTALLEQSSRPLKISTKQKTSENDDKNTEKNVNFDDKVQINEINTTETRIINSKPESYCCEVSSSCEEIKTNDWEDSNSPKDHRLTDVFAENFLNKKLETTKNKGKFIIDINDFDTTSLKAPPPQSYKESTSSTISIKNYKEEVDSKLNSLNIQIPKKKPTAISEDDDVLIHKFLRREKLNSEEIKRIRKIINFKKRMQQLQNNNNTNENFEIKRRKIDLKLHLKKINESPSPPPPPPPPPTEVKKKKKRFRNLHSDSPDDDDSSASELHRETAGEFSVYEGKGVKLIFKRKTDLLHLQPVVKLQRCGYIETMAKNLQFNYE